MNEPQPNTALLSQLEHLLTAESLSNSARQSGTGLLERLQSPVRTVILGPAGSGKSQIMNLLVGQRLVPVDVALPTLSLSWAKETRTDLTLEDETVQSLAGNALDRASEAGIVSASVGTDLAFLKRTSLLEVVVDGPKTNQIAKIDWAIEQADIVLWCSQGFCEQERALWDRVPDSVKDHSFFVLTKADELAEEGALTDRITQLQEVVAEDFHSLVPVATLQGLAATGIDDQVDQEMLKSSGGKVLINAVLRQAELGRQADMDSASLFLSRHSSHMPKAPRSAQTIPESSGRKIKETPDISDSEADLITSALLYLQDRSASLTQSMTDLNAETSSEILDNCAEITNYLVNFFDENSAPDSHLFDTQETFMEAADMLLLMQLENDEDAAADAVTLLLQLRRDLETKMAA